MTLREATPRDASALVALRSAVARDLTRRFGEGHWSSEPSEKSLLQAVRQRTVYLAKRNRRLIATLRLVTRKPWAIDVSYFTPCKRPLYLLDMAVHPDFQRDGIGRACLAEADRLARALPANAIRLDAYDASAGAGGFYAKCGYEERGRAEYRGVALIYYERMLGA